MRTIRLFTFIAALSVLVLSLPAAAQSLRAPPGNDNIANRQQIFAPFIDIEGSIGEATIEVNEQAHPCIGGTGENSVWYRIGATNEMVIVVDTTFSNYDTVVSVWRAPDGEVHGQLVNVDCEDDGSGAALLKYPVTASGIYLVSVSRNPASTPPVTPSLTVAFDLDAPASKAPKGQTHGDAIPLKLNGKTTVKDVEYGIGGTISTGAPICAVNDRQYPVWFTFSVPVPTQLSFSSEGSLLARDILFEDDVALTLFPEGFGSSVDELACDDDSGYDQAAYIAGVTVPPGTYYLRVTTSDQALNALGPSRYKITTRVLSAGDFLINSDFEDNLFALEAWTVKNASNDALETNLPLTGDASFKFNGNPEEKSQLQQTVSLAAPFPVDADTFVRLVMNHGSAFTNLPFSLSMKLTFSDGTTAKVKHTLFSVIGSGNGFLEYVSTGKQQVMKIKIAVKFTGTSGSLLVDNFDLHIRSLVGRGADPLPLPPPAN